jgi:hypothetical protein
MSLLATVIGLAASPVHAQKKLDFEYTGSVMSSLVASDHMIPDVYSFVAEAGQEFVLNTSLTSIDTTIRVIGPDADLNLFNDDAFGVLSSYLQFSAPVSGTYVVIVATFGGYTDGGNYALNFERRPLTVPDRLAAPNAQQKPPKK